MDYIAFVEGVKLKIPYRVYPKWHLPMPKKAALCRKSRYHDGYAREAALKELLSLQLAPNDIPYIFLALADYVLQINKIPLVSSDEIKSALSRFAQENKQLTDLVEAKTISYWNEYYRDQYPTYAVYPPYAYLQTLKTGSSPNSINSKES